MNEPRRLFDCIELRLARNPESYMLSGKESGQWKSYTVADVAKIVDDLAAGLLSMGISANDGTVEGRDKIAILSKNRPEWLMLDMAVQKIGAILTPVYPTINVNELEFVLRDAQVKLVFVNDEDLYLKVFSLKDKLPDLREIFSFEHAANVRHWKEVTAMSKPELIAQIKPISDKMKYEDVATILYTLGTT